MAYLILIRHGQSEWNLLNKWTGHTDVELSDQGKEEARKAASLIKGVTLHRAHTSDLKRAQQTLDIILEETNHANLPIQKHHAIKERDYGDLTGMNKDEAKEKFGEEKFKLYRRSWDVAPPNGESLKDTADRAIPYYEEHILKDLKEGHNVIVAAHGNSLRAIVKHLEQISDQDIVETEIGTGVVYMYELDSNGRVIKKEIRDHNTIEE
jgi:2,3-bisphosphoglycerate-dependent phosphoglycerate mutase